MKRSTLTAAALALCALACTGTPPGARAADGQPAPGAAQPRICFGNEPSWGLDLTPPGAARLSLPDAEPVVYTGTETRNAPLRESIWRGAPPEGSGDLVAFLREAACSDGMSDASHPVTARVSLADGRFLAGCCRVPAPAGGGGAPAALEGASWRLASLTGQDAAALAAPGRKAVTARFQDGRVAGFSGCNQFGGSYKIEDDRLVLGPLASTKMACLGPAMALESAFTKAFAGRLGFTIAGRRLTLTSESGATLVFEAEDPGPA